MMGGTLTGGVPSARGAEKPPLSARVQQLGENLARVRMGLEALRDKLLGAEQGTLVAASEPVPLQGTGYDRFVDRMLADADEADNILRALHGQL
jgi:hypothetical protein